MDAADPAPARRRIGILGAGMITTVDGGYLPGLAHLTRRAEVIGIASRSRGPAEHVAERFGIPRVFDDLESMLPHVDIVINCTPIGAHAETSLAVVGAGKDLVSEKPLALARSEADRIVHVAQRCGAEIVVAPSRMLESSRRRAARMVRAGAIGTVLSARFRVSHAGPAGMPWPADPRPAYESTAGPLADLAPYAFEQVEGLIGTIGRLGAITARSRDSFEAFGDGPFERVRVDVQTDDTVSVLAQTIDGCVVSIESSYGPVVSRAPAVEIFGTDGTIALHTRYGDDDGPKIEVFFRSGPTAGRWVDPSDQADVVADRALARLGRASLVEHLLDSLDAGRAPIMSGAAGARAAHLIAAARRSARTARIVTVDQTPRQ